MRNELISYAESFASFLLDSIGSDKIRKIILFGSVARGDFDRESDIDIFIDSTHDIEDSVRSALKMFRESETNRKWALKGIKNEISVKVGDLDRWRLKRSIISSGIMLYGKYTESPKGAKQYLLISLRFKGKKRSEKMRIWRKLYGYRQKLGKRTYESLGLLGKLGGKKIENALILVPMERRNEIIEFLNKHNLKYRVNEVWSDSL